MDALPGFQLSSLFARVQEIPICFSDTHSRRASVNSAPLRYLLLFSSFNA
jgi:hypothetical protein